MYYRDKEKVVGVFVRFRAQLVKHWHPLQYRVKERR
jgi:hypothetical protein